MWAKAWKVLDGVQEAITFKEPIVGPELNELLFLDCTVIQQFEISINLTNFCFEYLIIF